MTLLRTRDLDRVWDDFFLGNRVSFTPDYDVTESEEEYSLTFELPGVEENSINIEVKDIVLTLDVKSEEKQKSEDVKYLVRNRKTMEFKKSFRLPEDIEPDKVEANFKNGLLTVKVGKREEVKPKKIEIKS